MSAMQRFPMTREQVSRLVRVFYAEIRRHPVLGPIFLRAIGDNTENWHAHEAKIESFWRNAILIDREYQGNPMRVHLANSEIAVEHFPIWLDLFEEVARRELKEDKAERICALARRIGRGLSLGVALRNEDGSPPDLRC